MLSMSLFRLWRRIAPREPEATGDEAVDALVSRERYVPDLQPDVPYGAMHVERYRFASGLLLPGDSVLDIACGSGYGTHLMARFCREAVGVDRSPAAVDYARARYGNRYRVGDFFDDEGRADVVVSFETVEHVAAPLAAALLSLAERAGRMVVGSVPYLEAPGNPFHRHFGLTEKNLGCLRRCGDLEIHYQEKEPGFGIRRERYPETQNLVFVLRRRGARPRPS
ncbi:MAG: class I SAM-dependent methyltransferase [Gemmatimonadota bacterium]